MSNGNKGKFSDRLKRMKLYRLAKHRKMIIKNGKLVFEFSIKNINDKKVRVSNYIYNNYSYVNNKGANSVKNNVGIGVALGVATY